MSTSVSVALATSAVVGAPMLEGVILIVLAELPSQAPWLVPLNCIVNDWFTLLALAAVPEQDAAVSAVPALVALPLNPLAVTVPLVALKYTLVLYFSPPVAAPVAPVKYNLLVVVSDVVCTLLSVLGLATHWAVPSADQPKNCP